MLECLLRFKQIALLQTTQSEQQPPVCAPRFLIHEATRDQGKMRGRISSVKKR